LPVVPEKNIVILGGGLSGLSAARRLLDHGYCVTLVEKRPFLGGRAFSFRDGQEGVEVDNGQHVFLGCCAYYLDFLDAIGATDKTYMQPRLRTEVVLNGKSGVLSSTPMLGRLHLLTSFIRYPHLGLADKLRVLYGLLSIKLTDRTKRKSALDEESCDSWLRRHHQTDRAIANLWNLFILPALNDDVRDVSADMALMVFQESLLKRPSDAAIGMAKVGLTSLNGEPAQRFIEERGGELIVGKPARSLNVENGRVSGVELSDGTVLRADAYVSALQYGVLLQLLPDEVAADPFFSRASSLSSSPILGIHIWYDRRIMDQDFVSFLDSSVQWVFNKSLIQGADARGGQYVCISVSGAWRYIDMPKAELKELFIQEMATLFPQARQARVERCLVVKESEATFRSAPGSAKHRLPQTTPIPNLFLAGEWTDTGWPSTMEGAVRSGVFAADAVAERFQREAGVEYGDL
jgi:squalene-associated FAD-dependent desaturase